MKKNSLTLCCIIATVFIIQVVAGLNPPRLHDRTIRQVEDDEEELEFVGGGGHFAVGGNFQFGGDVAGETKFTVDGMPIRPQTPLFLQEPQTPYLTNDIQSLQPSSSIINQVNGVSTLSGKGDEGRAALLALVQSPTAISGGLNGIIEALTSTVHKLPLNSQIELPGSLTNGLSNLLTSPVAILKDFGGAIGVALSGAIGLIKSPIAICGQILRGGIDVNTLSPENLPVDSNIQLEQSLLSGPSLLIGSPVYLVVSILGSFAILFAVLIQAVVSVFTVTGTLLRTIVGGFSTLIIPTIVGASAVPLTFIETEAIYLHSLDMVPGMYFITNIIIKAIAQLTTGIRGISGGIGYALTGVSERIDSFANLGKDVFLGSLEATSLDLYQEESSLGKYTSFDQFISASANMPKAFSAGLSGGVGTFVSGVSALVNVPAAVSGQAIAKSGLSFGSGDDVFGLPSSWGIESFITGITTVIQSPALGLKTFSSYAAEELGTMINDSPVVLAAVAISGNVRRMIEFGHRTTLPGLEQKFRTVFDSVLGKPESFPVFITALLESPTSVIGGLSAGLANIAVGILGVLTSPLGISGRIVGGLLGGFGSTEIPQASLLPNSGTVIHTFVQSPAVLIQTVSAGIAQGLVGILAVVTSPVTASGEIIVNSIETITSTLFPPVSDIKILSNSLFMSIVNAIQSPGLTLQVISGSIMNAYNELLTAVVSPVSFSGRLFDGTFSAGRQNIQSTTGSFVTEGVIDSYVDSAAFVASIPGRLVMGLSGGALASIASIITTVASPVAGSGNVFLYSKETSDRLVSLDSNDRTSIDMVAQTVSTIFTQPLLIPKFLSGSSLVFIGDILSKITSPLAFSGQIVEAILDGFSPNIYFLPQSEIENFNSIVTSIGTAIDSPGILVRGLSTGMAAVLKDFLGTVASPVSISGQTIGGISTIFSSITEGSPITAINSGNIFDGELFDISLLPLKTFSGLLISLVSSPLGVIISPLTLSSQKIGSVLETVTSGSIGLPSSVPDVTSLMEQIGFIINSPTKILHDFSAAFRETISSIVNLALSPLRFLSGSRCFCL